AATNTTTPVLTVDYTDTATTPSTGSFVFLGAGNYYLRLTISTETADDPPISSVIFTLDPNEDPIVGSITAPTETPEPAGLTLLGLGLAGMAAYRRRRARG